jgi:thiamine pyrophosphate-dependent acetolactate synthase large subunit-like protein
MMKKHTYAAVALSVCGTLAAVIGYVFAVALSAPSLFVMRDPGKGAKGYRVEALGQPAPILRQAISDETLVVVDCPVDYAENMKPTERLGKLVCPIQSRRL